LERRFATHIQKTFGYENLQDGIQQRFSALQQALLTNKQQSFFLRLISDLEHSPWLSALCQALLSKPLKNISDKDEAVLYQSFTREIEMLDNLCDLSKMATDTDSLQNAILVDIHTVGHGRTRQVVQLSPDQKNRVEIQKKAILAALSDDQSVSIAVITTVLKDLLDGKG
jgi:hypothetical protein